jgi:sarcosine/dimethylglycine N-methyltransferase
MPTMTPTPAHTFPSLGWDPVLRGQRAAKIVTQDDRAALTRALARAREAAYTPGEFIEQESFMRPGEIRDLALRAGIAPGVSVLDLCCGIAGPGRYLTRELGCSYLGVDANRSAIEVARDRAHQGDLACQFEVQRIPPIPRGPFEVVLLLETMLAFADKPALLQEVGRALAPGGRFAFTLEEGAPLSDSERARMPAADTVWLSPLSEVVGDLERAGLSVRWQADHSRLHLQMVEQLTDAFAADAAAITAELEGPALDDLLTAHRLWRVWLRDGRVRKFAIVAEKM